MGTNILKENQNLAKEIQRFLDLKAQAERRGMILRIVDDMFQLESRPLPGQNAPDKVASSQLRTIEDILAGVEIGIRINNGY